MTPPVRTKNVYGVILCGINKNPVNGQNSFHSQGSFYSNIKKKIWKAPPRRLTAKS